MEKLISGIDEIINKHLLLLKIFEEVKDKNGLSNISQKEVAELMDISPSLVSKKLKLLIKYGAIEKVKSGQYKVIDKNKVQNIRLDILRVLKLATEKPDLFNRYKQQAEELKMDFKDIQRIWGYILFFIN